MTNQAPLEPPTTPEPSTAPAPPPGLFSEPAPAPVPTDTAPQPAPAPVAQPVDQATAEAVGGGSSLDQPLPPIDGAQQLVVAEKTAFGDTITALVTHASKPGASTSEFWAQFVAPPVTFAITLAGSWAVTHGIVGDSVVANVVPPAAASLTAALATWAAKLYGEWRVKLKLSGLDTAQTLSYRQ